MSDFITRYSLPRIVIRGEEQVLDMDLYSTASAQQTVASGTVSIWLDDELIVDAANITPGAPATYTLAAATTTGKRLSERWLEKWTLVVGSDTTVYQRSGHLVRTGFHATLVDQDLYDAHSELEDLLTDLSETSYEKWRERARTRIERDLLRRGRRPYLVFDSWALYDAHLALTLQYVFEDFASTLGQGLYKELAEKYAERYRLEMSQAVFKYDTDETGTISTSDKEAAGGPIMITSGPVRPNRYY